MKKTNKILKKAFLSLLLAAIFISIPSNALAASFGNSSNGASTKETAQLYYSGAAWNYSGSGYKFASFKYTSEGKTLLTKTARSGKVTGGVWDSLNWNAPKTTFSWNRG